MNIATENPVFVGNEHTITCPSGRVLTIRETNGDDDDVLSNLSEAKDGTNLLNFISNIVIKDHVLGRKPMPEDVLLWKSNDKYYTLFKQRLLNQGTELTFSLTCDCSTCQGNTYHFDQDLTEFDCDFSKISSEAKNKEFGIKRYANKNEEYVIFDHPKGRHRFKNQTGVLERKNIDESKLSKNFALIVRELEREVGNEWQPVLFFSAYTSKEASLLRAPLKTQDVQFDPQTRVTFNKCKTSSFISIMAIPAFYFPEETT